MNLPTDAPLSSPSAALEVLLVIHPTNVVSVAEWIVECEQQGYCHRELEAHSWLQWLKESLQYYRYPHRDKTAMGLTPIEALDRHLTNLLRATRQAVGCLTPEGQAQLAQYVRACVF